ncbi:MAG: tetratricopeptide repeat protein [Treponema sp.]|jgi:tetratricopeptide (TPR) repeat protein|nr:tetratricopeptide repeat protein [Treponema sp.]
MRRGKQRDGVFFPEGPGRPCLFRSLAVLLLLLVSGGIYAQSGEEAAGDRAVAERYAGWARRAMDEGRWTEAEAALERAADYADVSSELSWLLALVRLHEKRLPGAVLEALRRAIAADRWESYPPEEVRLLEAALLIRFRFYAEALESLSRIPEGADAALLRLRALMGLRDLSRFRGAMKDSLERYPRDPRQAELLFAFGGGLLPGDSDRELMDTALRRLPLLLEGAPDLAWMAVPFIGDTEEARRRIAAYRAGGGRSPAAIPAALRLGLIGERQALEELFSASGVPPAAPGSGLWTGAVPGGEALLSGVSAIMINAAAGPDSPEEGPVLDKALLLSVWELLRNTAGREAFRRNLLRFSGVIIEDRDGDGFPESAAWYEDGLIRRYVYDEGQDCLPELTVFFDGGLPFRGETAVFPEAGEGEAERALVFWERYPSVLRVELGERRYFPQPLAFFFRPLRFRELGGDGPAGFMYPETEGNSLRIGRRSLVSSAVTIEEPGEVFRDAVRRVEMDGGVPRRSSEWLDGRPVSVTEFVSGRPFLQRIDLDLDGRPETIRRYGEGGLLLSAESDWDGDRIFETGEEYFPDGRVSRSWDMDRDGIREYIEINPGE